MASFVRINRRGITRTVIITTRYAIKVPSLRGGSLGGARGRLGGFARGLLANQSEYQWHDFEPWAGKVAPVLRSWLGGFVQVYPRCEPVAVDALLPLLDPDPGDHKLENFGVLNGRVVRVDYEMT